MFSTEFDFIINNIFTILDYFIPGYIILKFRYFLKNNTYKNFSHFALISIIISYLLFESIELIYALVFDINNNYYHIIIVLISIVIGIIGVYLIEVKFKDKLHNKLIDMKIYSNTNKYIWQDIIDQNKGTYLRVFLKDEKVIYCGPVHTINYHKENNNYVSLIDFRAFDYDLNSLYEPDDRPKCVTLKLDSIDRVESFYPQDSFVTHKYYFETEEISQ